MLNKKNLEITCTKAFPHDINLVAKAGDTVVGKLKIPKNSQLYPIKLAIIKVRTLNWDTQVEEVEEMSDSMLTSFKGINYYRLLSIQMNSLYGLTKEEKDELFELYIQKKPIHEYIDRSIRHFYSIDNTHIPSYQFDDVEE